MHPSRRPKRLARMTLLVMLAASPVACNEPMDPPIPPTPPESDHAYDPSRDETMDFEAGANAW